MIRIDTKDIKQKENLLKGLARRAYPFATKETINSAAWDARAGTQELIKKKLTTRNKFTEQSVKVTQAKGLNVKTQIAVVGSIAPYFEDQEFGSVRPSTGKHGRPIPTAYSSGEGTNAKERKRLPKRANKLRNIRLTDGRRKPKNRKQATVFAVQNAVLTNKRTVYLDLGKTKGIFKVLNGSKKFKRGWPKGARLKMLYNLDNKAVTVTGRPTLGPAAHETAKKLPEFYSKALDFQLKRLGLIR